MCDLCIFGCDLKLLLFVFMEEVSVEVFVHVVSYAVLFDGDFSVS